MRMKLGSFRTFLELAFWFCFSVSLRSKNRFLRSEMVFVGNKSGVDLPSV